MSTIEIVKEQNLEELSYDCVTDLVFLEIINNNRPELKRSLRRNEGI
jgi:hypothetical protein